jgi:hypothetical protein
MSGDNLIRDLTRHERRLNELEARGWPRVQYSTDNVADPPTGAELNTAFGTPEVLGPGFVGVLNDNAGGVDVWLCVTLAHTWWYVAMTLAV